VTQASVIVHPEDSSVFIVIRGEIDLENAETVEEHLTAAIPNRTTAVSLDLGEVEYVDSAGLRVLFALAARLEVLQIGLRVTAPPGSLTRRVLELSGFEAVAPLEPGV
jgi:anti-anti-sigma factor